MLRPLVAVVALALPLVPARAATEEYGLTPACRTVAVPVDDDGRTDYAVVGTAAARSTISIAVSATIHCRVYDATGLVWESDVKAPGTFAALAGEAYALPGAVACGWAEASFLNGQHVETHPCP